MRDVLRERMIMTGEERKRIYDKKSVSLRMEKKFGVAGMDQKYKQSWALSLSCFGMYEYSKL